MLNQEGEKIETHDSKMGATQMSNNSQTLNAANVTVADQTLNKTKRKSKPAYLQSLNESEK